MKFFCKQFIPQREREREVLKQEWPKAWSFESAEQWPPPCNLAARKSLPLYHKTPTPNSPPSTSPCANTKSPALLWSITFPLLSPLLTHSPRAKSSSGRRRENGTLLTRSARREPLSGKWKWGRTFRLRPSRWIERNDALIRRRRTSPAGFASAPRRVIAAGSAANAAAAAAALESKEMKRKQKPWSPPIPWTFLLLKKAHNPSPLNTGTTKEDQSPPGGGGGPPNHLLRRTARFQRDCPCWRNWYHARWMEKWRKASQWWRNQRTHTRISRIRWWTWFWKSKCSTRRI